MSLKLRHDVKSNLSEGGVELGNVHGSLVASYYGTVWIAKKKLEPLLVCVGKFISSSGSQLPKSQRVEGANQTVQAQKSLFAPSGIRTEDLSKFRSAIYPTKPEGPMAICGFLNLLLLSLFPCEFVWRGLTSQQTPPSITVFVCFHFSYRPTSHSSNLTCYTVHDRQFLFSTRL